MAMKIRSLAVVLRNAGPMRHRLAARGGARNETAEALEEAAEEREPAPMHVEVLPGTVEE